MVTTMAFNRKMVTTLPMAAQALPVRLAWLTRTYPSGRFFSFEPKRKNFHTRRISTLSSPSMSSHSSSSSSVLGFSDFGFGGEGAARLLAAMAMRRLVASSLRARSFCSSSAPAQLGGVQETVEPGLTHGEIGEVSGIPEEHLNRKVVIYSPSRCTTQSGPATSQWKISFGSVNKWENPLMGWTSTGDPYHSVGEASLNFDSKERAVGFAEKYGWQYTVREPHQAALKPRAYADNFKWKGPAPEFD